MALDDLPRRTPTPLAPAFGRRLRRAQLLFVALATAVFALQVHWVLDALEERSLNDRASLCAASLEPGSNGDLSDAVDRLLSQYDGLLAVATLSPAGDLESVHPERPAHRSAAVAVRGAADLRASVPSPLDGTPLDVAAAVVPLHGFDAVAARKALFIFRAEAVSELWTQALGFFAASLAVGGLCVSRWLGQWFQRRVVARLDYLGHVADDLPNCPSRSPKIEPCVWTETDSIGRGLQVLVDQIAATQARARHLRRQAEQEIRQREHGFDQELRRVSDRATVDALTKVRNRAFFEEKLEPLFHRQRDAGLDLAAVMIDVDNFKQYNDQHGHQVGDLLLKFVGALLRGAVRPDDHAIRYGGDEFVLLLPGTNMEQASAIAERLVRLFGQYTRSLHRQQNLSLSVGVASLAVNTPESGHQLVVRADQALYLAKRRGKNTVVNCPRNVRDEGLNPPSAPRWIQSPTARGRHDDAIPAIA